MLYTIFFKLSNCCTGFKYLLANVYTLTQFAEHRCPNNIVTNILKRNFMMALSTTQFRRGVWQEKSGTALVALFQLYFDHIFIEISGSLWSQTYKIFYLVGIVFHLLTDLATYRRSAGLIDEYQQARLR